MGDTATDRTEVGATIPDQLMPKEDLPNSQPVSSSSDVEKTAQGGEILIGGVIERLVFRNTSNGFTVAVLQPNHPSEIPEGYCLARGGINLVGALPLNLNIGSHVLARGRWQEHSRFGPQFRAFHLDEIQPTGSQAIERYLGSRLIRGIGPSLASRIVERFGDRSLEILDNNPDQLLKVAGIGKKKLKEILDNWQESRGARDILLFFQSHNISMATANRIFKEYGNRAVEVVKNDPYVLAKEVWGIGFLTADRIASSLGIGQKSPARLHAGLGYALYLAREDGHTFLHQDDLFLRTRKLLGLQATEPLEQFLEEAEKKGFLICNDDRVYLPSLYVAEYRLSQFAAKRLKETGIGSPPLSGSLSQAYSSKEESRSLSPYIAEEIVRQTLESNLLDAGKLQANQEIKVVHLSDEQQLAVQLAASHRLLIITGGPGCGKTTLTRALVSLFNRAGLNLKLAAPTGRAAQRMAEVTGHEASTIHRLLKYDPIRRKFIHNENELLDLEALILDEASMIDLELAASLFAALPEHAHLVIVGDADQLPSVGPGCVLGDLLKSPLVPRVTLTQLFRRAEESAITSIAHQINHGQIPDIPKPDGRIRSDAYFLTSSDTTDALQLLDKLFIDQIPRKFGIAVSDICVLSPMNQGPLGIQALNRRLQNLAIPPNSNVATLKVGTREFRLGDRVCQRINNYNLGNSGVFNGDQGTIIGIDTANNSLFVRLWDKREVEYTTETLEQLDLAYAITIHRAQGSEIPAVILLVHDSHAIMLERQLVYTGITRAKQLLIVIGTGSALRLASQKSQSRKRNSYLVEQIESNYQRLT